MVPSPPPADGTIAAMISVDEAQSAVLSRTPTLGVETVSLAEARDRVLRAAVVSDRDLPPFDRAAMDGFAVRSVDVTAPGIRLSITGEVRAGAWPEGAVGAGEAFRIMTGAPLPRGADAVVQVERTRPAAAESGVIAGVFIDAVPSSGQNFVPRGSEAATGTELLPSGLRLGGAHLAVLASVGVTEVTVAHRPRVAVIVTGDEVVDPSTAPTAAQIRNANGPALVAAIAEAGGEAVEFGVVPDDAEATRAAIARALDGTYDAIVLSGGVSAGDFDFVEPALAALGVVAHVTAVRVKPGAPFVFATRGDVLVFGLPGNPVSAQVTFELFARPSLLRLQGAVAVHRPTLRAVLDAPLANRSGRRNFLPVSARFDEGVLRARPVRTQGSGDIAAHAQANGFAVLEPEQTAAAAGDTVSIYPLPALLEV